MSQLVMKRVICGHQALGLKYIQSPFQKQAAYYNEKKNVEGYTPWLRKKQKYNDNMHTSGEKYTDTTLLLGEDIFWQVLAKKKFFADL